MNKQLEKRIERLELLKSKEELKKNDILLVIDNYERQLKVLYDYKKQQEKIILMQQELNKKIEEGTL